MDDLKKRKNSVELFLAELHIPDSDCRKYVEVLRSNGYEDIVFLLDDVPVAFLESFMRQGHASRVIKRLQMLKSEDLPRNSIFQKYGGIHNPLRINMDHAIEMPVQSAGRGCYRAGSFEISPSGIDSVPHGLPSTLSLDISPPRHTQEAIIVIREIGRGASGIVYKCLYIPTLTFVAVKCIQVSNKSKRDQILTELTALYTVSNSGLAKFENLPCPNKINLGISAQNSSLSPEESTNIKRGLETITVLAKEVKSRGPNTIKLTLPLPLPLPPPIWPKTLQRCHTVPLSGKLKECIIHPSVLSTVSTIFPVLDADSALSNRMKVLNVDRAKGALSASIPSWQPIITSSEGEVRNNSVERSTDDSIPDTQGSSLGHEDEFLPSSNVPTFTEGRQCGPCPYVVTFYDAYTDPANEAVCLVMQYMGGGSLQNLIDARYPVQETAVAIVAYSVLRALEELHSRNIIHRDVKPANILCSSDGDVKLADFGIVREVMNFEDPDTFTGTLDYMCPQRLRGEPYNFESDVWSLGSCLVAFMTGKRPCPNVNNTWEFKSVFEQKHQNSRVPSHPIRRREGEKHVHIKTNEDGDIAKRMDNVAAVEDGEGIININYYDGGDVPDGIVSGHGYANDCHNNFISDSCNLSKICPDLSLDKYSCKLHSFLGLCLAADLRLRPTASALLQHPFIKQAISDGAICPPSQPRLQGIVRPIASAVKIEGVLKCILDWYPEHADEMVLFRTERSLIGSGHKKGGNRKIKGQGQGHGHGHGHGQGQGQERDPSLTAIELSPEILGANPVSQLSMPAIKHLAEEFNVCSEEVLTAIRKLQKNSGQGYSLVQRNPLLANSGNHAVCQVDVRDLNCIHDLVAVTSPLFITTTATAKMGETDNASIASPQIEEKTWEEAVETGNTEDAGSIDNEEKCVRKENKDKDIRERTKAVKTIQAAQKMTSICIQPKEHCRLKKFSPYQQPHNRSHELLHYMPSSRPSIRHETRWPPCTPTDAITNAYASTHNRLNPFAMAGVGRSNSTNCVGASFNPTCIPVSAKSDPGYIGTLPALIQHCQSFDSSTGLMGREIGSNCTGFDREGRAPKDDMTTCDGEESLIPIPELIRVPDLGATESSYIDSGPVSHCVPKGKIYESITNNPMTDESNSKSRVSCSFCPVIAEVGTAFSELGKKDLKLNIEAIQQDGVMDASITPTRSSSASVGNMSPDRPFPNLFISIPKDDYIAPMHIPETCPLRRVVSTCSLYDCFDEMGRQIGCDRDGNPIMDTEGNLRSLSSISFPRHTPQGYTPRHSPGGTAVRNSSPPNSPKDFVCRAFSPSLVSAVIHSTPRPEVPRGFVNYSGAAQSSSKEGSGKSISHSPPIQYSNFNHYDSNCNSNYNSTYCSNLTGSNSNYNSNDNLHGNFGSLYDSSCNSHHNSIHSNSNNGNDSFASPEYIGFSLYRNSDDFDDNYVGLPSILSGSRCSSVTDGIFLGSDCYMTPPQSPHGNGDIYNEGDYSIVGLRNIDSIAEIPGMDTAESYSRGDSQGY